jgi:hypothetical protein
VCLRDGCRVKDGAASFLGLTDGQGDRGGEAGELEGVRRLGDSSPEFGRRAVASGSNRSEARVWEETKKRRRRMRGVFIGEGYVGRGLGFGGEASIGRRRWTPCAGRAPA